MAKGRFLLLYGSETGQSQAIAEEIHELAPRHDVKSDIFCLSLTEKKFSLPKETCVVIIVSTTGEGECPETAMKFWRRLRKTTLPPNHLSHLNYALLALGDSNYNNFCRNGKNFDERLQELGAKRFYPTGCADDAVGLEVVVEPWIEGLWKELHKVLDLEKGKGSTSHLENDSKIEPLGQTLAEQNVSADGTNHVENCNTTNKGIILDLANVNPTQSALSNCEDSAKHESFSQGASTSLEPGRTVQNLTTCEENIEETAVVTPETVTAPLVASLKCSLPPLSESGLTLPVLPPPYLTVEYSPDESIDLESLPIQGGAPFPSASSSIIPASVVKATQLTSDDAVKTALDIELRVPENTLSFQPGDSFSVISPNLGAEVSSLLSRLGVSEVADAPVRISLLEGTKKRKAAVPDFMGSPGTLRHLFSTCCDIRALPKKAFLRVLVEHTSDPGERRRLQELCSKQGQADYAAFLRGPSLSLLDVLRAFPSCLPPIQRVLEHVTRLQPRPYSISSSPLSSPNSFHFVFNVVNIPAGEGRSQSRTGVCTGWLSRLAMEGRQSQVAEEQLIQDVGEKIDKLSLTESTIEIPIFSRTNQRFHLPTDSAKPLILIGPGTGVAPFVGFLEHRSHLIQATHPDGVPPTAEGGLTLGPVWLFFGCRHKDRDFLYREKLERFVETGVLSHLCTSFSRDQVSEEAEETIPRYVQDNLRLHREELATLVLEKEAHVYVCGDAKHMARNVVDVWKEILKERTGQGDYEVLQLIAKMREENRYMEDVWT